MDSPEWLTDETEEWLDDLVESAPPFTAEAADLLARVFADPIEEAA